MTHRKQRPEGHPLRCYCHSLDHPHFHLTTDHTEASVPKITRDNTPPPDSRSFAVGDQLQTVKELSPKIPRGTPGEVMAVNTDANLITVRWLVKKPDMVYTVDQTSVPTNGYEWTKKVPR